MHILTLCRLGGTFPLLNRGVAFDLSIPWFLYSWALVTANAVAQAMCILMDSYEHNTPFFAYMSITQRGIRILCPPVCLFCIARNRRLLAKHIQILNSVDSVFRKFGANPEVLYRTKHDIWLIPMGMFCSVFEISRKYDGDFVESVLIMLEQTLTSLAVMSAIIQFVFFVDQVITKLKTLNESLDTFVEFTKYNTAVVGKSETLLVMSDAHYLISVSTEYLNDAYSSSYFTLVSGIVCMLIVNVYKDTAYFSVGWYLITVEQTCWTSFWLSCVGAIVFPAARASKMSSDFNRQLSHLIIDGYSSSMVATEESESHNKLVVHVDFNYVVKFSCGFFDLDRFLIHSILGGICSFSVILMQISAQDESGGAIASTDASSVPAAVPTEQPNNSTVTDKE